MKSSGVQHQRRLGQRGVLLSKDAGIKKITAAAIGRLAMNVNPIRATTHTRPYYLSKKRKPTQRRPSALRPALGTPQSLA